MAASVAVNGEIYHPHRAARRARCRGPRLPLRVRLRGARGRLSRVGHALLRSLQRLLRSEPLRCRHPARAARARPARRRAALRRGDGRGRVLGVGGGGAARARGRSALHRARASLVDFVAWQRRDYGDSHVLEQIATLPSASFAWVDGARRGLGATRYWSLPAQRATRRGDIDPDAAARRLRELLDDADAPAPVRRRCRVGAAPWRHGLVGRARLARTTRAESPRSPSSFPGSPGTRSRSRARWSTASATRSTITCSSHPTTISSNRGASSSR